MFVGVVLDFRLLDEGLVLIADAVNRLQVIERRSLAFEQVADLHDVLVERTTSYISVYAPDRMDQVFARDDCFWVLV